MRDLTYEIAATVDEAMMHRVSHRLAATLT